MRALVADPAASPALSLADVLEPSPGPGEPPARHGGGLGQPGEIRSVAKQPPGAVVIGWDVAGTVAALGEGVTQFDTGERVVALARRAPAPSPNGWSSRRVDWRRCRPPATS